MDADPSRQHDRRERRDSSEPPGARSAWRRRWAFLHEGHATLFRQAQGSRVRLRRRVDLRESDAVRCAERGLPPAIPAPFADSDVAVCEAAGVDLIFNPDIETVYPPGFQTFVEVRHLQHPLCGHTRPTHFRGVATVVLKLLQIVRPHLVYFGQKDAQQARLLLQMVRDLDVPVDVIVCPIVREPDGLAMSSRNRYLSPEQPPPRRPALASGRWRRFADWSREANAGRRRCATWRCDGWRRRRERESTMSRSCRGTRWSRSRRCRERSWSRWRSTSARPGSSTTGARRSHDDCPATRSLARRASEGPFRASRLAVNLRCLLRGDFLKCPQAFARRAITALRAATSQQ